MPSWLRCQKRWDSVRGAAQEGTPAKAANMAREASAGAGIAAGGKPSTSR